MPLTVRQLLDDPALCLSLAAGDTGVDARGPVRWAHISELPDPTPWLEGGEVLLTTGLGVRHSEELQRRLVRLVDARGLVAIGFGEGVSVDAVPPAIVEQADACGLPLFTVPYEIPFIAVTRRVSQAVFEEHYATLRQAIDLHRSVLGAVLAGRGVKEVLRAVASELPGFSWMLFDYYGEVLATAGDSGRGAAQLWAVVAGHRDRARFSTALGGDVVTGWAIRAGADIEALLVVLSPYEPGEHEVLLLEQALAGVSLELARGVSVREAHRAQVDRLLAEVAEGRIAHRALAHELSRLDLDPSGSLAVACVRAPRVSVAALCGFVEDALAGVGAAPVVGRLDGRVYAVLAGDGRDAQAVAVAAARRGWGDLTVGRSRAEPDLDTLDAALREAAAAADLGGSGVWDVADLGLPGLLAGLGTQRAADAYVERVLGPLVAHDRDHGGDLVATLAAYLRHGCRPGPAAADLRVHRHTLAYRLDRIGQLTGRSVRTGRDLVEMALALELQVTQARHGSQRWTAGER